MQKTCRVLIVDDHELASSGIALALSIEPDYDVAGTVANGKDVMVRAVETRADIVLLDINLPDISGLDVLIELVSVLDVPVVILTGNNRAADFSFALKMGALGLVSKSDPIKVIVEALNACRQADLYVSPCVQLLLGEYEEQAVSLSPRQMAILHYLAAGETNKEIAYRLQISPPTVSFHLRELRAKLGVAGNKKILNRAADLGLLHFGFG